jgi:glutamate N-acetyltransferase/amino-acid N-acetyltransferase
MACTVKGFDAGAVAAGIKKSGAPDLALVASRMPCRAAGVFTRNLFPAAPVIYDRQLLDFNPESIHAVLVNAGCANACTGPEGEANARIAAEQTAHLGAHEHSVFVMSTGVIGVQLPMDKLLAGIPAVVRRWRPTAGPRPREAIMTTDTRPKLATPQRALGDARRRSPASPRARE